ncbi:CTP synthase [Sesamum alatum]|uniref:CTP synthase (glutamine hydrolyzing) n=1 Tax=Sesamum alatum TaxID=300844 RepID=A0AAE2D133_9LAMI|nr:CTP synthase [Sesamum alatum]
MISHNRHQRLMRQLGELYRNATCVLVPGGFGDRGVEGMILATKYARENRVPYLGICLGMQISVIEIARNVLGLERTNSTEFNDQNPNPVVIFMPEGSKTQMGSTMRLGSRKTLFQTPDCITVKLSARTLPGTTQSLWMNGIGTDMR